MPKKAEQMLCTEGELLRGALKEAVEAGQPQAVIDEIYAAMREFAQKVVKTAWDETHRST